MGENRSNRSNLKAERIACDHVQAALMELAEVMGTDEDGEIKNHAQITAVIQLLFDTQEEREHLESTKSVDTLDEKKIRAAKQVLLARTAEFKQLVEDCFASFSKHTQALASEHLQDLIALYVASYNAINATLNQKYHAMQTNTEANPRVAPKARTTHQEPQNHQQVVTQIQNDFELSYQRASELLKKLQHDPLPPDDTLSAQDEATYLRTEILDAIDIEIKQMQQLEKKLNTSLLHTDLSESDQLSLIKTTQEKLATVSKTHALLGMSALTHEASLRATYKTPERPIIPAYQRTNKLKRQQAQGTDSDDTAAEKKELLAEISRIKSQLQNMTNNLTNEIPQARLDNNLKTYKRNKLLTLSRDLYLSSNPSLEELRKCAKKFSENLKKCQNDAKLRQGIFRRNCRTLIDSLSKDLENNQHAFHKLIK